MMYAPRNPTSGNALASQRPNTPTKAGAMARPTPKLTTWTNNTGSVASVPGFVPPKPSGSSVSPNWPTRPRPVSSPPPLDPAKAPPGMAPLGNTGWGMIGSTLDNSPVLALGGLPSGWSPGWSPQANPAQTSSATSYTNPTTSGGAALTNTRAGAQARPSRPTPAPAPQPAAPSPSGFGAPSGGITNEQLAMYQPRGGLGAPVAFDPALYSGPIMDGGVAMQPYRPQQQPNAGTPSMRPPGGPTTGTPSMPAQPAMGQWPLGNDHVPNPDGYRPATGTAGSNSLGAMNSPPPVPVAPPLLDVSTANQQTAPLYSDSLMQRMRNQQLADMARVTPESALKQYERGGVSRSAGNQSRAFADLAKFQGQALGGIAQDQFGMARANEQNRLDQQYRRENEALGLARGEFGLQDAYRQLQDQDRQRQLAILNAMLRGAGALSSYGGF